MFKLFFCRHVQLETIEIFEPRIKYGDSTLKSFAILKGKSRISLNLGFQTNIHPVRLAL